MIEFYTEQDDSYCELVNKFERLHSKKLRRKKENREAFFGKYQGRAIWMFVDGVLMGEILWEEDEKSKDSCKIAHIASFSVAKNHQDKGYGSLLKQVLYNILRNMGYKYVTGSARKGKSWNISKKMGAKLIKTIKNYYETGETYYEYKQKL